MAIISSIGSLELLNSEMIHTNQENKLAISIDEIIFIEFDFVCDDQDKTSRMSKEVEGDNKLIIKCINFNNSIGEGILTPLNIGVYGGRQLFLSFFVWTPDIAQGKRIINYCLYLQKL